MFGWPYNIIANPAGKIIELLTTRAALVEWKVKKKSESCAGTLGHFELHGSWLG